MNSTAAPPPPASFAPSEVSDAAVAALSQQVGKQHWGDGDGVAAADGNVDGDIDDVDEDEAEADDEVDDDTGTGHVLTSGTEGGVRSGVVIMGKPEESSMLDGAQVGAGFTQGLAAAEDKQKPEDSLARFVLDSGENLGELHMGKDRQEHEDSGMGINNDKLRDGEDSQMLGNLVSMDIGFHKQGNTFPFSIDASHGGAAGAGAGAGAADGVDRVYRKGIWMLPELLALQTAKKAGMGKFGYRTRNNKSEKERWQDIENVLWSQGVQRSADQCRSRWEYISREFRKIAEYESSLPSGLLSYWQMSQAERKDKDLPINFYGELFQAMCEWMGPGKGANSGSSAINPSGALMTLGAPADPMDASKSMELINKQPAFSDSLLHTPTTLGRCMEGSCVEAENDSAHIDRSFGYKTSGKRRKTTLKPGDRSFGLAEQSNRAVWPREVQLQANDGSLLLCNCSVVHLGTSPLVSKGEHILIRNKKIAYVGPSLAYYAGQILDLGGRFVVPGLCDAHVHVTAVTANLHDMSLMPPSLITARATKVLQDMLMRGFTTVRDVGGCDWGLAKAVEEGTVLGPRILFSGHALSQTGGHGDMRMPSEDELCSCSSSLNIGRVCDGVAEVRKAARDELRKGAHQIKIMASGGVASPSDHLNNLQFSSEEISAIVEEANHCGKYVCAHAYTAAAAKRVLELGVRSIEHGNFLDGDSLDLIKRKGAFLVPTLVTYNQIRRNGQSSGMAAELVAKVGNLLEKGMEVLAQAEQRGVNICFGTDLLGSMHENQLEEFSLRSRVQSSVAILRSATSTCAQLFNLDGKVGTVSQGAFADLLVLEKNPVADISILEDPSNIIMILKEGEAVKLPKGMVAKVVDGRTLTQIC